MSDLDRILGAIRSEATTFPEFCRNLKECPKRGDREAWRAVFAGLEQLRTDGLVTIIRQAGEIQSLQLTPAGADRVRAQLDAERGLFAQLS